MSRLVAKYPTLIHPPETLGKSRQGRAVQVWCVTEGHEGCDGSGARPAVLYTALVHAREPATLMCLVHALREVLHDADRDGDRAAHLLRTRKLLFMPLANPDGYAWNAQRRPRGGGMKRKNGARTCSPVRAARAASLARLPLRYSPGVRACHCRLSLNLDRCPCRAHLPPSQPDTENDGVDLNRNFGYKYAYDNTGSSSRGCSEEYRGTGAFSEPETQVRGRAL